MEFMIFRSRYDVDNVRLTTSLDDDIYHWINSNCQSKVYVLHLNQKPRLSPLLSGRPEFDNTSLLPALDSSRVIKSPVEISLIRHAVNLSSTAHYKILHSITSLKSEAEIHALFLDTCIAHGAKHQGYPPIVASGTNASTLHYSKNDEALKGRGLVCLDAGCEWECYSSDVTRTFPIGEDGWASKETVDIYGIVEEMQERCIEKLRPGIAYIDLHILAHSIAIEGLLRIGIFKKDVDVNTVIERGFSKAFFPHGLGHHMGLEVHDVSSKPIMGQYQMERKPIWFDTEGNCTKIDSRKLTRFSFGTDGKAHHSPCSHFSPLLEENMVLTVEPGICEYEGMQSANPGADRILADFDSYTLDKMYLPIPEFVELIDESVLDRYMHVGGVRIEDDILITANGYENLTSAPKGKEMLRIIRDGAKCQHGVDCLDSRA